MNIVEARRILQVSEQDDIRTIKMKFRRLMGAFHPDATRSEEPEHIRRAQEINEAYTILKKYMQEEENRSSYGQKRRTVWQAAQNESAFADRDIYVPYSMDVEEVEIHRKGIYQTVARGKYMWDPEEEEFPLFLKSVNHAAERILEHAEEEVEREVDDLSEKQWRFYDSNEMKELRFPYQAEIFRFLTMQFIQPWECLNQLVKPDHVDAQGRRRYCFRAWLGAKGVNEQFRRLAALRSGEMIYPKSLRQFRLMMCDREGHALGCLSMENDAVFFCLIPLLKEKKAQMKVEVCKIVTNKRSRPYQVRVELEMNVRLEQAEEHWKCPVDSINRRHHEEIIKMIEKYKAVLRQ